MKSPEIIDLCKDEAIIDLSKDEDDTNSSRLLRRPLPSQVSRGSRRLVTRQQLSIRPVQLSPSFRRLCLQVFQYLSPSSIETTAALVCRSWFQVSRDEELWKAKYIQERNPEVTLSHTSYRAEYIDLQLGSCWNCNRYINYFGVECISLKRLLCMACSRLPDCRILPIKSLVRLFYVQESTLELLKVPVFLHDQVPSTYLSLVVRKVRPYYERRRDMLIRMVNQSVKRATLKKLREFDFGMVTASSGSCRPRYLLALLSFCGKNDETEGLSDSLKAFIEHVNLE